MMPLPVIKPTPILHRGEERIALLFKHDSALQAIIRKHQGVRWSQTHKCWHIPCTEKDYDQFLVMIKDQATADHSLLLPFLQKRKTVKDLSPPGKTAKQPSATLMRISAENLALLHRTVMQLKLKAYSESTIRTYKNEISIFLQTIKNHRAAEMETDMVKRYIHHCITALQLSENTIHSRLNALKFMYEQVLGKEKFFVDIPRPKKHLQLPKVLGEEELRRLFAAPQNLKHKAILFVAYSAGLRVSEVINLRLQDIDRERQQLFIHCSKGKKDRYVRLSPMVLDILEQYYKLSAVKPVNFLFEGGEKGKPYTIRSAQQIFTDARAKAGILKSLSFHSLRHSFATHLLEKGTDVIFIKEILGHFNIKTTERYLHIRRDFLINIESPLDDLYKDKK